MKHLEQTMTTAIYCIGAGRVTRILLEGLTKKNHLPERIMVTDTNPEALDDLAAVYRAIETKQEIDTTVGEADFIFIGLHPPAVADVIKKIAPFLSEKNTFVSLAPKVKGEMLMELSGWSCPVIRMIPNAASYVNAGYNPVWYGDTCPDITRKKFNDLMSPLGEMPEVPEQNFEAYAVITAMGPTYLWFQLAELTRLAETFGLSSEEARQAVIAMSAGTVRTMQDSGLSPEGVMDLVPVKPMAEHEETIKSMYAGSLSGLYGKLTS